MCVIISIYCISIFYYATNDTILYLGCSIKQVADAIYPVSYTHLDVYKRQYNYRFERIRDTLKLNPEHRPHDPRKHFSTMAKKYKVDEYALKYMIGHKIEDITEKVYTQRDVNWLKEELEKIV